MPRQAALDAKGLGKHFSGLRNHLKYQQKRATREYVPDNHPTVGAVRGAAANAAPSKTSVKGHSASQAEAPSGSALNPIPATPVHISVAPVAALPTASLSPASVGDMMTPLQSQSTSTTAHRDFQERLNSIAQRNLNNQ